MTSLVVAMTLTPALCSVLLRGKFSSEHEDGVFVRLLKRVYRPTLALCSRWRRATLGVAGLLTVMTLWFGSTFGSSFLPEFNEGTYTVFLMMPPGTSLEESERVALNIERRLLEVEGIEAVVARSGRAERDEHAEPPSSSEVEVRLAESADPAEILSRIDEVLAGLPGVTTAIGQPISHRLSHVMSGTKAQIAVDVYGEDLALLRDVAKQVEAALRSVRVQETSTRTVKYWSRPWRSTSASETSLGTVSAPRTLDLR